LPQQIQRKRRGIGDTFYREKREDAAAGRVDANSVNRGQRFDDLCSSRCEVGAEIGDVRFPIAQRNDPRLLDRR